MIDKGLTDSEVVELQKKYGKNELVHMKKENFFIKIFHIVCEPMFLLLILAATIYFILGEPKDGIIMLVFVIGIISIDIIQEWKTDKTLSALKDLSEPKITVLRNSKKVSISSTDLVPGDIMFIHEGVKIPADGVVIKCSGLRVTESSLTGESTAVWKNTVRDNQNDYWRNDYCYQGTLVVQGTGVIRVDKIGSNTEYGKIGVNLSNSVEEKTLLQKQTDFLVKFCAIIALILFILVSVFTFFNLSDHTLKERLVESILSGITLAMAMIPEEFPVVLTVFLSMGAWRLAKKNSLVKRLPSVETLGAVSVLCVDKTGTITKNEMEVSQVFTLNCCNEEIARSMCLCSDEETFDPMEQAMFKYAKELGINKKDIFSNKKVKDYPFSNTTKMMGCVHEDSDKFIVSAKGSFESIIKLCEVSDKELEEFNNNVLEMQKQGLRVIAVASRVNDNPSISDDLTQVKLDFMGVVGLVDPPRDTISDDILRCKNAGVRVVMITGDNGITASSIARSIGIDDNPSIITGDMLNEMDDFELCKQVRDVSIFSRVIPEHKMRIVKALQDNGEIVAMTGDGVNDAPALKKADIGIAMGKRGSMVTREAADLILMDDNFSTIVDTIHDGRRIYDNIKKAIGYIFVIHIPIALSATIAPILGIMASDLMLLPLHVVLLELIIDPTCSIVLEREPAECNIMNRGPRNVNTNIVDANILLKSIIQGLVIFASSFGIYYCLMKYDVLLARTCGLLIIMFSNIFLVQVNSSESDYVINTIKKLINDKLLVIINSLIFIGILVITYSPINNYLKLKALSLSEFSMVILVSFTSVFWYEIVKFINKRKLK